MRFKLAGIFYRGNQLISKRTMSTVASEKTPLVFISCGSFNPVTNMHLRMFELAKDKFKSSGKYHIVEGIISPVSNGYKKKGLIDASHRCNMIESALAENDWVHVDKWEASKDEWTPTLEVLQYHKNEVKNKYGNNANLMFLCGADLVDSFLIPNIWKDEHIQEILAEYGLACINRMGSNAEKVIYENDILYQNKDQIHLITDWIINDISSTKIRRAVSRNESIKYVTHPRVEQYIKENQLYQRN